MLRPFSQTSRRAVGGGGGWTAPAGAIVEVLQENRLSVFVTWERKRAWIDRRRLLDGNSQLTSVEKTSLATDVIFQKPTASGTSRQIEARRGAKVDVLVRRDDSVLVRYQGACGWIPSSALGAPDPFGKRISASVDGFAGAEIPSPEIVPSKLCPELVYEKMVPFEVVARITSLRHYNDKPPANGYDTGATSWADYNLAWGPLLDDRTIRSSQGDRRSSFRIKTVLPGGVNPYDFCHNFHIVCDSEELKARILAAKEDDFVTLTGALVRVFGNPDRFPNPISWTSSVAGEYCYVMLVEELENH